MDNSILILHMDIVKTTSNMSSKCLFSKYKITVSQNF